MDTLLTIVVIGCTIYALVALGVYSLFRAIGLSRGKAFLVTMAFMLFGLWHPLGWLALGACVLAQYAERRELIAAMDRARVAAAPESAVPKYSKLYERGGYARTN
jgi:hypothetical protein